MLQWSLISAVNDERVLKTCLLDSPGIRGAAEVALLRGYPSASAAYNAVIQKTGTDLLVFVHQDVFLPDGWIESVERALETLAAQDPKWGVLGVWGAVDFEQRTGYLYWTGAGPVSKPFLGGREVACLDEVVLILRKSSGLTFDDRLPGYHLYGADICLEARRRGRKCYAISAFCIHNTNAGHPLPLQFWQCYLYMRRKWKGSLPIDTPCTRITFSCWPILRWNLVYLRDVALGRRRRLNRAASPRRIYERLLASGARPIETPEPS
jgi:hypothetical protein